MRFKRHATNLNYFLPFDQELGWKVFVFSENNIPEFSLPDALTGTYKDNFLLIFFKDSIEYSVRVQEVLQQKARNSSAIYWLDDFKTTSINGASNIYFTKNVVKGFDSVAIGLRNPNIQIASGGTESLLSYNAANKMLDIKPPAGKFHVLAAHNAVSNLALLTISLNQQQARIGTHEFTDQKGIGAINFQVLKKPNNNLPQPVSPFYADEINSANPRAIPVFYFDKTGFNTNADLFGSLKPYKVVANTPDDFSSYFETVFKAKMDSNFSDQQGGKFSVNPGKLVSRVASIEYLAGTPTSKCFFFIPQAKEKIQLVKADKSSSKILAGFNGTECFSVDSAASSFDISFAESDFVSIKKEEGEIHKHGDSMTSMIQVKDSFYHMDSEGSPLFENSKGLEPSYNFIQKGAIAAYTEMPLIPTFSFSDNEDLMELEDVFKKVRLKNVVRVQKRKKLFALTEPYVTPQGFLKNGNTYSLIRPELTKYNNKGNFQFSIEDKATDLDISIRKEEVFFVLTPGLYEEYGQAVLSANFSLNKSVNPDELFELALDTAFKQAKPGEHNNSIVLFKFHKKKTSDLLKDPTLWSNYGAAFGNMSSLREVKFQIEKNKMLDIDDHYFTNSILEDPNWNGIIILNVPIADAENLPTIFTGLSNSQRLSKKDIIGTGKLKLETELFFKYAAFPVNKTMIDRGKKSVSIASTSYYGLIDYNPFSEPSDYKQIANHFNNSGWRFILSKLKVRFANSSIAFFESFAFLQVPELFDDTVKFNPFILSHGDDGLTTAKPNLVRLKGSYQKNSADTGEFLFNAELNGRINFGKGAILKEITLNRIGFSYSSETDDFRFDLDAGASINDWSLSHFISIRSIDLSNIGLKFKLDKIKLPHIDFDLSRLLVLPEIDFNGKGFLSSFPIRFSHFKGYKITKTAEDKVDINFDFLRLPGLQIPDIDFNKATSLFSFIFDFDLGTLGNLVGLKSLKGQLLMGWSMKGGFVLGFKINGPSTDGLHIDLFGALKLDIDRVDFCKIKEQYLLRLENVHLKIISIELPSKEEKVSAMIFAQPGKPVAWLITYLNEDDKLNLGIGQRVGLPDLEGIKNVDQAIQKTKDVFDPKLDACRAGQLPIVYKPEYNWLVASENIIPDDWKDTVDLKFIFNDPVLYGVFLRFVGLFDIDILYKKVSDNLGVWSLEFAIDPSLRNIEMGAASITLPNLGIDIYTNGDWKLDVGFPVNSSDWSRSCLFQVRPFVGWAGFYVTRLKTVSLSLFAQYLHLLPKDPTNPASQPGDGVNIIQSGFAFRIGLGAYVSKAFFYAGASISIYGILEGAFAFNKYDKGLAKFFPDHFALRGRVGAIAEIIGYVDFKIIKAGVHILLRVEFGFLLAIINGKLQPVPVYIEGEVSVRVSVTIACFRIFRKRICIVIHLSFSATVRFPYTIGGDSKNGLTAASLKKLQLVDDTFTIKFGEIPVLYIPSIIKTGERGNQLVHQFALNLFGCRFNSENKIEFSKNNVLKDRIIAPIFEAILSTDDFTYSALREIFMEGAGEPGVGKKEYKFNVSSFKPTLFAGYTDLNDKIFLKDKFGLDEAEANSFIALMNNGDCAGSGNCPYRIIPIPITSTINVQHKDGTNFSTDNKGFTIELKELFNDATGSPTTVKTSIRRIEEYTEAQIAEIEKHFDNYMTQFVSRPKAKIKQLQALMDIREDAVLPEYFKLVGLLTLEAYFNFLAAKQENREKENFDPKITMKDLFGVTNGWNLNDHLDGEIIGQLNYFFNNGLRLPDPADKPNTISYYEMQRLNSGIHAVNKTAQYDNVDIVFAKNDGSIPVSFKNDIIGNKTDDGLKDFIAKGEKQLDILFPQVQSEFKAPVTELPYRLPAVKIPIGNSTTNSGNGISKLKFFEIPQKVRQQFGDERMMLNLEVADNKTNATQPVLYIPCINIEATIRPHLVNKTGTKTTKVAELINVRIEDLTLMHRINNTGIVFSRITIYLKKEAYKKTDYISIIKPGEESKTRIVRANLSPRTHPPVILETLRMARRGAQSSHVASLLEKADFTRILWEGLTTNNGGYYLIESPDSDLFNQMKIEPDKKASEYTLVFSFESDSQKPYAGFHNSMLVADTNGLFSKLDASSHSLNADVLKVVKKSGREELFPSREYYSTIPAHCFAFSIERTEASAATGSDNYLPVEFGITGNTDITMNSVLPLMPVSKKDENGTIIPGKVFYNHITPLHKVTKVEHTDRYKNVGQTISLKFAARDIYGYRAFNLKDDLSYKHVYFDKIIPINAWPFIDCSYWFKSFSRGQLSFELKLKAFHKGVKIKDEEKETLYQSLHTILAQLSDSKVKVSLNYPVTLPSGDLKSNLIDYVSHVLDNLNHPVVKESKNIVFSINITANLKTILEPSLTISRPENDSMYVKVDKDVWEAETIRLVQTGILAVNPLQQTFKVSTSKTVEQVDVIKALNTLISTAAGCPWILGIGLNEKSERAFYLIRKDYLAAIKNAETSSLPRANYFAIKPYSNRLWSGKYRPVTTGKPDQNFSNIDLDKGLSQILSLVDNLLSPDQLFNLSQPTTGGVQYASMLLQCKKALVETELKDKTDNIDEMVDPLEQIELRKELRDMLLNKLNYFYQYDGIISLETIVPKDILTTLNNYRFTVNPGKFANYNIESSKIYFTNNKQSKWFIQFDQINFEPDIALQVDPSITHIEFDIKDMGSEIESSSWIQLVEPFKLSAKISTIQTDPSKKWPSIIRKFPQKPSISEHRAEQIPVSGDLTWTASNDFGKWQYLLSLRDFYESNDQLDIIVKFRKSNAKALTDGRNFKGFIAYWSAQLAEENFIPQEFVEDFFYQMELPSLDSLLARRKISKTAIDSYNFILEKVAGIWKLASAKPPFNIELSHVKDEVRIKLFGKGFDIFDKTDRITAVLPEIKVKRNRRAKNDVFVYVTETVSPASWAVPQIRFDQPIKMSSGVLLQSVFMKMAAIDLPYKSTGRFILKINDLDKNRLAKVPAIPVRQMEFAETTVPSINPIDKLYDGIYKNGYPAVSITVYNNEKGENELPLFIAGTIFKDGVVKKKKIKKERKTKQQKKIR